MDFIQQIVAVRKPASDLLSSLEKEYCAIGSRFGYVKVQSPLFLMLKRPDSQVGFEVQFGSEREFEQSLLLLQKSGSGICFLVTSSKSHSMRLNDIKGLLMLKFQIKDQKFVLVDIENSRSFYVNFEWDKFSSQVGRPDWSRPGPMPAHPLFRSPHGRSKPIYGKRGEHKKQD